MAFNLKEFAIGCGLHDPEGFVAGVDKMYELVIETNKTMNHKSIKAPEEFRNKHVADSLAIAREFPEFASEYLKVAEIGCGAVLNPGAVIGRGAQVYPLVSVRGTVPANCIHKGGSVVEKR